MEIETNTNVKILHRLRQHRAMIPWQNVPLSQSKQKMEELLFSGTKEHWFRKARIALVYNDFELSIIHSSYTDFYMGSTKPHS